MSVEDTNLRDEAGRVYLEQVLVFDEMERLRLARTGVVRDFCDKRGRFYCPRLLGSKRAYQASVRVVEDRRLAFGRAGDFLLLS